MKDRNILLILVAGIVLSSLTGCGGGRSTGDNETPKAPSGATRKFQIPGCPTTLTEITDPKHVALTFSRFGTHCHANENEIEKLVEQL